jgi:deoxyhypusine synthase
MIKKFNQYNESIRDQMKPKSKEEIINKLNKWTIGEKKDLIESRIGDDKLFSYLIEAGAKKEHILRFILDEATEENLKDIIIEMIGYNNEEDINEILEYVTGGYNRFDPDKEKEILKRVYNKYMNSTGKEEMEEIINNIILQNPVLLSRRNPLFW